jgi:hypothetical protein
MKSTRSSTPPEPASILPGRGLQRIPYCYVVASQQVALRNFKSHDPAAVMMRQQPTEKDGGA